MDRYMWQEDEWTTHSLRLSQMQVLKPVILTLKTVTATNRKVHSSGYILSTIWRSGCQIQHSQFHRRKCFCFEIIHGTGLHRKLWGGFYPSFLSSYLERLVSENSRIIFNHIFPLSQPPRCRPVRVHDKRRTTMECITSIHAPLPPPYQP